MELKRVKLFFPTYENKLYSPNLLPDYWGTPVKKYAKHYFGKILDLQASVSVGNCPSQTVMSMLYSVLFIRENRE